MNSFLSPMLERQSRFKEVCYGEDLSNVEFLSEIRWIGYQSEKNYVGKDEFWIKQSDAYWIDKLAGTEELKQIDTGWTEEEIKQLGR